MTEENLEKNKEGSFMPIVFVMIVSLVIAGLWDKAPVIKNSVLAILNPTAGALLSWDVSWGMTIIVLIITILVTLVQKYATDQKTLKEIKKEQKDVQKQMKEFRSHPGKMMELQKKSFSMMGKQMKLGMRGIVYTGVPFILFFRWFQDFFATLGDVKFFGIIGSWFLFYIIISLVFGGLLRKWWDVV